MSRCRFVGRPPVPFLPFYLDLNKLTPEGAREIEEAARTSELVPAEPTSEVRSVTSASPSTRPSFSASRYLVSTPAAPRATSVPAPVRHSSLLSFTKFLRARMPVKSPATEVSHERGCSLQVSSFETETGAFP